jgi:transcriptional regulator with XRE-family HTH domain
MKDDKNCDISEMLGKRLKEAREARGLTQDDVANYLNVKRQTYSAYERNKSVPDALTLNRIAELFKVSNDYLLHREMQIEENQKKEIDLSEKDMKEIKQKAEHIRTSLMSSVGLAFDGKIDEDDEDTLTKVMAALEEGMILAKKEAKEKYTPKKYRK